jgi:hypothetical protein
MSSPTRFACRCSIEAALRRAYGPKFEALELELSEALTPE